MLRDAAATFGDDTAIVDGTEHVRFSELAARAADAARALIAAGVQPGDRVALWAPNSVRWIVASFGVYAAGAVLVPLNTRYKGEEAGHVLRTSRASVLLGVTDFMGTDFLGMLEGVPGLGALEHRVDLADWDAFLATGRDVPLSAVTAREAAVAADDVSDI
ncbi:MAG TPA: AMP-binding protein, partial [Acidimicrobiales bacterium]|nr:AMP-binding protein [Acidimicrobiales bacterium]